MSSASWSEPPPQPGLAQLVTDLGDRARAVRRVVSGWRRVRRLRGLGGSALLAGAELLNGGGHRLPVRRAARANQGHRLRWRIDALERQLAHLAAGGRRDPSREQDRKAVARAFDQQRASPRQRRLLLHLGRRVGRDPIGDHRIVDLDVPGRLLTVQPEGHVLGVGAGLDQHRLVRRVDPLEVEPESESTVASSPTTPRDVYDGIQYRCQ